MDYPELSGAAGDPFDQPLDPTRHLLIHEVKHAGIEKPMELLSLASTITSAVIHHWNGRNLPHVGTDETCPVCIAGGSKKRRWEGYLQVQMRHTNKVGWLRITPYGLISCPDLGNRGKDLRGAFLRVHRRGRDPKRAKQEIELQLGFVDPEKIRPAFDMKQMLRQMWSAESQADDLHAPADTRHIPY